MAKTTQKVMTFECTPDRLLAVLLDPEFRAANNRAMGHLSSTSREVLRTPEKLVLETEVEEYAKGLTGVDRSKTERTRTTFEWDLSRRVAHWTYQSPHGERVRVWGTITIDPAPEGSRLTEVFNVEIKIPLVGGQIEKMVLREADQHWPRYEKLIAEHCARAG
jgi:hypothetical protein